MKGPGMLMDVALRLCCSSAAPFVPWQSRPEGQDHTECQLLPWRHHVLIEGMGSWAKNDLLLT